MKRNNRKEVLFAIVMILLMLGGTLLECIDISKGQYSSQNETTEYLATEPMSTEQETIEQETIEQITTEQEKTEQITTEQTTEQTKDFVNGYEQLEASGLIGLAKETAFVAYEATVDGKIEKIIQNMTIEQKVCQLFFIKDDGRFDQRILDTYQVGGIILFAADIRNRSAEEFRNEITSFQDNSPIPLLIGTDEEGGTVNRVSLYSALSDEVFRSPRTVYKQGGFEEVERDTRKKAQLLLSYGVNVNFAPVCDLAGNQADFMYSRSFGADVDLTEQYIDIVVSAMKEEGIGSVLKHFPGYGNNGDTHTNVVYDKRSYDTFEKADFVPFQKGIDVGADCVLVSHNIVECMDDDWPASLSQNVHEILREKLGFDGVVITDDLMMEGVSDYVSDDKSAVLAILAGNDMILSTYYDIQIPSAIDAVKDGTIAEERINESVRRILRWKYDLNLLSLD